MLVKLMFSWKKKFLVILTGLWMFVLVQYVVFIYFTNLLLFVSNCRQFVAYGKSEVCETCRFWPCKRRICDRDDDCRNWDLPMDGSWGLSYSTRFVCSMDKKNSVVDGAYAINWSSRWRDIYDHQGYIRKMKTCMQ